MVLLDFTNLLSKFKVPVTAAFSPMKRRQATSFEQPNKKPYPLR